MRGWQVNADGTRNFVEVADRDPPDDGISIRMEAAPVLVQSRDALSMNLGYATPPTPFVPGTHGVGIIERIGRDVRHLSPGQRVFLNPHFVVNERVPNPARILIGGGILDTNRPGSLSAAAFSVLQRWRHGTYAEIAHMPASAATPFPSSLDTIPAERLAGLGKLAVPYSAFLRAGFEPGETVVVLGASGYLGSAAVLLALALGAGRVVAAGRDKAALVALADVLSDRRLETVALSGELSADGTALREAAGGAADLTIDLAGRTAQGNATLAGLNVLRRGGRLVLLGSTTVPLEINIRDMMTNDWHIMGCFMYPPHAPARLMAMIAAGLIDLSKLNIRTFPLARLDDALDAAVSMRGLDVTALVMTKIDGR